MIDYNSYYYFTIGVNTVGVT